MAIAGAIGVALSVAGTVVGYSAQQKMIAQQTQASKKAENAREQQMQLDSSNRRRQSVREAIVARSMGLAAGTNAGAQYGSGVSAALGQATAQGAENQQTVNSSQILGSRVFQANRDYFDATQKGQAGMALGQGLSAIGGALVSNAGTISQLGTYFGSRPAGSTLNRNM